MACRSAVCVLIYLGITLEALHVAQAVTPFVRMSKFSLPSRPSDDDFASAVVESAPAAIESAVSGFVKANGTHLSINGTSHWFSGSNNYFLILRRYLTDDQVKLFFRLMSGNGIDLVRTWAFLNGVEDPYNADVSMQPSIGIFNEDSFKRLDLILAEAAKNNVYIIFPFVNFWPDLGGMQWYVDQIMGKGHDIEEFYQNAGCKQAYKNYIKKILTRINTINGRKYSEDPNILSLELVNEARTTDNYEINRGIKPGTLIKNWYREMTTYIRTLDKNHMISTGEEGFLCTDPSMGWIGNGTKGTDFAYNLENPDIAFGTIHVYPSNWFIPEDGAFQFAHDYIRARAKIAHAAGKPIMLEETGMNELQYNIPRPLYYTMLFSEAMKARAVAMMPWELVPWHVAKSDSGGFDFGTDDPSFGPVSDAIAYQHKLTAGCTSQCGRFGESVPDYTYPFCQANIQVGPIWNVSSTEQIAKFQILLSAQQNEEIPAPYNVTLAAPAAYLGAQTWEWDAYLTPNGEVTGWVKSSYNTLKPNGTNVANIGGELSFADPRALKPTSLHINDVACSLLVTPFTGP